MGKRRKYECDICGNRVPEEILEHLRIFHPEEYSFRKMEFIENAVIIGLDASSAYKAINKMSGEDLQKAISEAKLEKKIPKTYNYIKDIYDRESAKRWYMRKLLLDERAKSLIRIVSKRLRKFADLGSTEKIALNLVERYTKRKIRSCYDERIIAFSALFTAFKFLDSELEKKFDSKLEIKLDYWVKIKELILEKEVDEKELFNILNWMEKQLIPDQDYIKLLLGIP